MSVMQMAFVGVILCSDLFYATGSEGKVASILPDSLQVMNSIDVFDINNMDSDDCPPRYHHESSDLSFCEEKTQEFLAWLLMRPGVLPAITFILEYKKRLTEWWSSSTNVNESDKLITEYFEKNSVTNSH